jgi:chemosensory pili system protein ChpA (sensor histidine kinase/response regulator)
VADNIDVTDAVDRDLFPVFAEEAEELLPQLQGSLREWIANPGNDEARKQVKRLLHTLKGGARLAGALRLGEMAHRAESAIEVIGTEHIVPADLEPILDHADEIAAAFGRLQADQRQEGPTSSAAPLTAAAAQQPPKAAPTPVAHTPRPALSAAPIAVTSSTQQAVQKPASNRLPVAPAQPVPVQAQPGAIEPPAPLSLQQAYNAASQVVRVKTQLLDRLVNQAGEVITSRSRLEAEVGQLRSALTDLSGNLERLRTQLRDVELQAETQMQSRMAQVKDEQHNFDPLEFDRFTRMQELTRMMAESVNDVATVQRALQRTVASGEDDLAAQARQARELQHGLLRTRMVEFESLAERLYRVVRQAAKEEGKQVRLDIVGGAIEVDRGILERMTPPFEHLLRNSVVHGVEAAPLRAERHKDATGVITIEVHQAGNDVSIEFRDDGNGLDLQHIRQGAERKGLIAPGQTLSDDGIANLVFVSGLSTASQVSGLAGRGVGMDVVRTEVQALGGRIETRTQSGHGTTFKLVLPLTTAVTQIVMLRVGEITIGVPSNLVELVRRVSHADLQKAYGSGSFSHGTGALPFFWGGALLQSSPRSQEPTAHAATVIVFHSAAQRLAMHVDEVLGNQEVVVKALGPQLSRLPGLAAITTLASGEVALIYNPVALATVYGDQAKALTASAKQSAALVAVPAPAAARQPEAPLVLVVDDSITVRRVTQRLLQREGYRVALAADGLQGLEQLRKERPAVVLSDIEMPRMDGFDFVRNIRSDAQWRDLPVVMITSRSAEKHREHARELGVNHYLGKPYSEEQLLTLIRDYVRAAAQAQ